MYYNKYYNDYKIIDKLCYCNNERICVWNAKCTLASPMQLQPGEPYAACFIPPPAKCIIIRWCKKYCNVHCASTKLDGDWKPRKQLF